MKLKLQFITAALIVLAISNFDTYGQANLTFSGGSGAPLVTTLQTPVTYTITNANCVNVASQSYSPIFVFQGTGDPFANNNVLPVASTMTFSINGEPPQTFDVQNSGVNNGALSANDIYIYGALPGAADGSTVRLTAGTTTSGNIAGAKPSDGNYTTFIINLRGEICSGSGVSAPPTAAPVSISGRVTTASGRGIRSVQITLTDSNGNKRTSQTTTFGYYRFHNVATGETVTLSVKARQFRFAQPTIVRATNDSISDADFVSEQ